MLNAHFSDEPKTTVFSPPIQECYSTRNHWFTPTISSLKISNCKVYLRQNCYALL